MSLRCQIHKPDVFFDVFRVLTRPSLARRSGARSVIEDVEGEVDDCVATANDFFTLTVDADSLQMRCANAARSVFSEVTLPARSFAVWEADESADWPQSFDVPVVSLNGALRCIVTMKRRRDQTDAFARASPLEMLIKTRDGDPHMQLRNSEDLLQNEFLISFSPPTLTPQVFLFPSWPEGVPEQSVRMEPVLVAEMLKDVAKASVRDGHVRIRAVPKDVDDATLPLLSVGAKNEGMSVTWRFTSSDDTLQGYKITLPHDLCIKTDPLVKLAAMLGPSVMARSDMQLKIAFLPRNIMLRIRFTLQNGDRFLGVIVDHVLAATIQRDPDVDGFGGNETSEPVVPSEATGIASSKKILKLDRQTTWSARRRGARSSTDSVR